MNETILHLRDLHQDPKNARLHNPRNLGMIVEALREVGAARSGVVDEEGRILAANLTWEALAEAGIKRVKVVEADGEEWVVVQRSGLTEEQKRRLALYDNRAAELADWDIELLADDVELLDGLWSDGELEGLLADIEPFGWTSTDRDRQGVSTPWNQVNAAEADRVIIGDVESRLPRQVVEMLKALLVDRYETHRSPISETLEAVIVAGVRAVETGNT